MKLTNAIELGQSRMSGAQLLMRVAAVVVLNPMFALNNGFKFAGKGRAMPPLTGK